ncbi:General transcription factor II-I repeat domain containing protein 2, partial [Dissostichus eleginoides]
MSAVRAFQRKLEVFKSDLQEGLLHFPKLLEQTKGDSRPQNHVGFLEKLIENFKTRFDDFRLGKQVLLYIENPFLVRNVREFSAEAQQIFPWASAASLQSELIDLQENLALKEADCDTPTFWTKMGYAYLFEKDFDCGDAAGWWGRGKLRWSRLRLAEPRQVDLPPACVVSTGGPAITFVLQWGRVLYRWPRVALHVS